MKFKTTILIILLPLLISAITINVDNPKLQGSTFQNELPQMIDPGNPMMPYLPIKILMPMGETIKSISITPSQKDVVKNKYNIEYARKVQPISKASIDDTKKNMKVYNSEKDYPVFDHKILGYQTYRGYKLLLVNLYPYKYSPLKGEISWYKKVEVTFNTFEEKGSYEHQNRLLLDDKQTRAKIKEMVINPSTIRSYKKRSVHSERNLVTANDPYEMIIITDAVSEAFFTDFINWKSAQGISAATFITADIYSEYDGVNDQEKLKNFILDAYTVYSGTDTPLEYVILGGDDEIVPIRTIYISTGANTVDNAMPSDLYYGCLDDNWDNNGNGIYGEVEDNADIIPEVTVARFPAETELEFNNIFSKTQFYVENTAVSNEVAYMLGENLNWNPVTWGGDYKDEIVSLTPSLDSDYHLFTLYDRDGTYSTVSVQDAIDEGVSIINHMGHSNETIVFGQTAGNVNSYTNEEYGFAYSQGCYPAAFDELTSHESECIAENLVKNEHGLYAFVGNTRYGWYMPGSTNGPSQPYDIEFFDAIFNENIRELGKALDESRIVLANTALTYSATRWVHMELVLFGDPTVEVKEPALNFPYIVPVEAVYDDSQTGDGDGIPNPGEEIEIFVELENLVGWEDASDVTASISFEDPSIQVLEDEVAYGNIPNGASISTDPFLISVPQDCNYDSYEYSLNITAPIAGNTSFDRTYQLSMEVSLFQQNWPWTTNNSVISNPIITDFNNDEVNEVMIVDAASNVNLLNINASQLTGFPWAGEANIWKSTALGDINDDGYDDIIIATRAGDIYALDQNGNAIFNNTECCEQLLTPMISDIDGDDSLDLISFGLDKKINVLDNSGNMLNNFPLEMPMLTFYDMATADLDLDNKNEIVIGTLDGMVSAVNHLADNVNNFPVQLSAAVNTAPIILDNLNIVVGTSDNKIHLISNTGEILFSKTLNSNVAKSSIAGNFDDNEDLEIVFTTTNGKIYVIDQNGDELAGWPVDINNSVSNPPLAVDLNDDGELNVICFSNSNNLYAFHKDGSEVDFAPVPVNLIGNTPSTIDDIDADGDFDIVTGISTGAIIIDCKLPKGNRTSWKTYRGNYKRTGYYGDNQLFTAADDLAVQISRSNLEQNYPNPFNPSSAGRSPSTTIAFSLAKDTEKANLEIFNIRGQRVKDFKFDDLAANQRYSVTWNGRDNYGKQVSSGIYFYQLIAEDKLINVKKCILIK